MAETKELWERIFAERLAGRPVTRVIVTHYHPDHIGLADWLTRRWQTLLWITEKEWLSARVMSHGAEDFAPLRRGFALRAGLDDTTRQPSFSANERTATAAGSHRCRRVFG